MKELWEAYMKEQNEKVLEINAVEDHGKIFMDMTLPRAAAEELFILMGRIDCGGAPEDWIYKLYVRLSDALGYLSSSELKTKLKKQDNPYSDSGGSLVKFVR